MRGVLSLLVLAGCGDVADLPGSTGDAGDDPEIFPQLQALPGVTVSERMPSRAPAGYRYFVLHVTQPVDHDAPGGATFQQEVSLIHVDRAAPMVAYTTGYDDYVTDRAAEPTRLLHANQISIEHRFFGGSRPSPAVWSKLTIAQMAADEHAIIALLKPIYRGAWLSSGASKGGMTAIYHRRFYPDDVAGTVAYVGYARRGAGHAVAGGSRRGVRPARGVDRGDAEHDRARARADRRGMAAGPRSRAVTAVR